MKKFFASVLTCALLLGLLPTAARAADDVPYLDRHWDESTKQVITEEKYASNPTAVTGSDTTWGTEGTTTWYVASGNVTIGQNDSRYFKRVTVTGDVHLILADGCTLTVYGGIHVADDDDDIMNGSADGLTIYGQQDGTGTLTAQVIQGERSQDNGDFAGIGGNKYEHGGAITINGGTVNAIGGMWAAGIGGGDAGSEKRNGSGGNITINGGNVTAACLIFSVYAYGAGAGIGGGSNGSGGNITINGGMVTATGQKWQYGGAGIGGCRSGSGGTITINGGTVIATGGEYSGAGIGGDKSTGGSITINGGNVTATGIKGAGIGDGGTITIGGGIVEAAGSTGGISGSFSTGTNGNAFITASSISDKVNQNSWSGVIFEGDAGQVYGSPALAADAEIPSGVTLVIPDGSTLTVPAGITLTNNGTINVKSGGRLVGNVAGSGTVNLLPPEEQFPALTPGNTYWFDLSGAEIPGTVNAGNSSGAVTIPDTTLHWVPFTYTGTINAYVLNCASDGQANASENAAQTTTASGPYGYTYDHSLFISDYCLTRYVRWGHLNTGDKNLIFGVSYASGGLSYTMRAPSAGSRSTGRDTPAFPQSNEWDVILNKDNNYIKNWSDTSWGQDTRSADASHRAVRGNESPRGWYYVTATDQPVAAGFRPVLELPAPDALASDGLKVITLDLNGGKAGTTATAQDGPVNIVVKSGESFTAPSGEGLTVPSGKAFGGWTDGSRIYKAGDTVPSTVTALTAHWVINPTVTISAAQNLIYNGRPQALIERGETTGGTLQYSLEENGNYSHTIPEGTDAGTYEVWYKVVGNDTCADVAAQSIDVTIAKAAPTANDFTFQSPSDLTYSGTVKAGAVTVWNVTGMGGITLRYFRDGAEVQPVDAGTYLVKIDVADGLNYTAASELTDAAWMFTIAKATPTVSVAVSPSGSAGAREAALTVTVTGVTNGAVPTGDVTFTGDNNLNQTLTLDSNGKAACTWSGLTDGQYTVTAAYNGDANYDTASDTKTFDTSKQEQAALTIGFVGDKTYGDPEFTLSASGGSGSGAVTYESSDPTVISISGTTATIHKAGGPVTITATKAEDENYHAASDTLSVTVGKKAVVFKANDKTVQQGGTMPTFDYAPVTLARGDSIAAEPTAACTATNTNTVGTFTITLSGAVLTNGDSYEISYQPGTLTVTAQSTYTVTVSGGTGGGSYGVGDTVTITAAVPGGQRFTGWTVNEGGVTLANASSATTTFAMPAGNVTVTANFQSNSGGGSSGGGGGGTYTPPGTPTYKPDVGRPGEGGGTPTVTPSNPKQGDTVTVTPKPDSGYEVDKITVTDRNGKPVTVTERPDGTYTFVQPDGRVTIEIEYAPVLLTARPWNNPFSDVPESDWYYEAVRFVHERDLMNGYSDGRFGPNDPLSRAQLAQILFNKEGRPAVNYLTDFSDVAGEAWYTEAIRWAASRGIVGGYGNGRFGPNDPITREQLAVMLWRYSGSPAATDKELHFIDTDEVSGFALEAMRWAVENGILNGYGDGRLGPQGQATRAQVAQMLKNFMEDQDEST